MTQYRCNKGPNRPLPNLLPDTFFVLFCVCMCLGALPCKSLDLIITKLFKVHGLKSKPFHFESILGLKDNPNYMQQGLAWSRWRCNKICFL